MIDQEYLDWLQDDTATPVTLVEVVVDIDGVDTTLYLSSAPYITGPAESPPNQEYQPLLGGGLPITEQVSLSGDASLVFGDQELANYDGALDHWLEYVWRNKVNRQWTGDASWPRDRFRLVFDGFTDDIDPTKAAGLLNIKLRDKMQRLNTAVTERKLGGLGTNADTTIPVPFGEVHNMSPVLESQATLTYRIAPGAVMAIDEVRDVGKPVAVLVNNATGSFSLTSGLAPQSLTVSVAGVKSSVGVYSNRIAPLVRLIATEYGDTEQRFTVADLDTANLDAFDASHPQLVGGLVTENETCFSFIARLAGSVGAQPIMSAAGKLRLVQIALPAPGPVVEITMDNILADENGLPSLRPVERLPVLGAVKIAYCRNYTPQTNMTTSIRAEHKDLYGKQWLTKTATAKAVLARYKVSADPDQRETCLMMGVDADTEAHRELDLRSVQRTIYQLEGTPEMLALELGAAGRLTFPRWGLDAGRDCVVVLLGKNHQQRKVTVGVMV